MGNDGEAINYEHQSLSKMKKQKETVKKELKLFEVHFDKFYGRSVFPSLLVAAIPRNSCHSHLTHSHSHSHLHSHKHKHKHKQIHRDKIETKYNAKLYNTRMQCYNTKTHAYSHAYKRERNATISRVSPLGNNLQSGLESKVV